MSEINPITSTSCEKMTGTGVHHVEHSKKSRDPSFERPRINDRNSPINKHISNTLKGVLITIKIQHSQMTDKPRNCYTARVSSKLNFQMNLCNTRISFANPPIFG